MGVNISLEQLGIWALGRFGALKFKFSQRLKFLFLTDNTSQWQELSTIENFNIEGDITSKGPVASMKLIISETIWKYLVSKMYAFTS